MAYTLLAMDAINVPTIKKPEIINIKRLRPKRSVKRPLKREPIIAPNKTLLTINSFISVETTKSFSMNKSAPEIIPVSKPNNNPAIAAMAETP